jgi:glycerophosphoryl diester phosphodiesterase
VIAIPDSEWLRDAPLVIAHRGASSYAPENTFAAFRLASDMGVDAVEVDARLTRDGRVVVHHDRTLDRTTTGSGVLAEHTLEQIQQLDAGRKFDPRFAGERVPTLDEVLAEIGDKVLINVDLTYYGGARDALPEAAASVVRSAGQQRRVLFSSFYPQTLRRTRRLAPEIATALLTRAKWSRFRRALYRQMAPGIAVHPEDEMVTAELIEQEHVRGQRVNVWTVNDADRIRKLLAWGVDGVITDIPDVALRLRDEQVRRG